MTNDILLMGCQPEPLASYLKGLAVLRLVSEQKDHAARGLWSDEGFVLKTRLNEKELLDFFVDDYAPTPLVSPWNFGSGFYEKDNKTGIEEEESQKRQHHVSSYTSKWFPLFSIPPIY